MCLGAYNTLENYQEHILYVLIETKVIIKSRKVNHIGGIKMWTKKQRIMCFFGDKNKTNCLEISHNSIIRQCANSLIFDSKATKNIPI